MSDVFEEAKSKAKKLILGGLGAIVALILVFGSFEVISPSEKAVKVTLGTASEKVYGPGLQLKLPILTHFDTVSAQPITQDVVIEVGPKGAVSSDNQTIGLSAKVAWTYDTSRVRTLVTQYPDRSKLEDIINSTTYEALKTEIGKYTIFDLAKSANKIANDAKAAAALKVKAYPVVITQVNLTNWDWDDAFDARIKATMNAQQAVAEAKANADKVEQEQRELVIKAEAAAKSQVLTAEASAKSAVAQATGERDSALLRAEALKADGQGKNDYNRLVAQNMQVEVQLKELDIKLERAKRFNGVEVPTYLPLTANGTLVSLPSK